VDPPLRVTPYVWESHPGRLSLTIACELAFRLVHGAEAQPIEPVRFYDDDLAATALADVRAPYKPRCDLLIVGHAFSPVSQPEVDRMLVRVRVGEYAKAVRVTGDRLWTRNGAGMVAAAPRPWRRMLLAPERAGRSGENPRGMDLEAMRMEHRAAFPNIEPTVHGQEGHLGPVPTNAPRRATLLHPHAAAWAHALFSGQRAGPPPEHFGFGYFNIAPADQQLAEIPYGAAISLEGLHPEHSLFTSRLPASRVRAYVFDRERRAHVEVEMRIDTLWIDADREVASIVARGLAPVSHPDAAKHITVRVERFQRTETPNAGMFATHAMNAPVAADLPFMRTGASPRVQESEPPPDPAATARLLPKLELPEDQEHTRDASRKNFITQEIFLEPATTAATPFEVPTTAATRFDAPKVEEDTTQNLGKPRTQTDEPPPPEVEGDDAMEAPTPPPHAHTPEDLENTSSADPTAVVATSGPVTTMQIVKLVPPDIPPTPPPPLPPKPQAPVDTAPAKPALVGKLLGNMSTLGNPGVRLGMTQLGATKLSSRPGAAIEDAKTPPDPSRLSDETTAGAKKETKPRSFGEESTDTHANLVRGVEARTLEEAEAEADRDAFEFPLPPSDGFEVDGVTLEHCAAVRATLSMPGASRADVLAKNDLDDATWARIEKAHMSRIDQETSKGLTDLLNRYDASYVAAQDKLRRPIGVKEFARITVARERGALAETLSELSIPRSELMRLDRVWQQRRLAYPEVDKAITATIEALKSAK